MKKVNLLIPKRGRSERVDICLHYLNLANREGRYDVQVTLVDDAPHELDVSPYGHLAINYVVKLYPQEEGFRRGALLNHALRAGRPDWDWFSLVDLDMVYHPAFYDLVARHIAGTSYVVCRGNGLDGPSTCRVIDTRPPYAEVEGLDYEPFTSHSQVSCSRAWYDLFREITGGDDLFSDDFCGWGHEDTVLETLSSTMTRAGLARKTIVEDVWFHLYHPPSAVRPLEDRNLALVHRLLMENEAKLRAYVRAHVPPTENQRLLQQATSAHRQGEADRAVQLCRQILDRDPGHAEALHVAGLLHSQRGDHLAAEEYLRRAIAADPGNPWYRNNLGEVYRKMGQLDQAVAGYREALAIHHYAPEVHYNLANVYKQQGRLEQAVAHYQQALRLQPDHVKALYNLGNALLEHGQPDDAARAYRQVIRLDPRFVPAHHNLGTVLARRGRWEEAAGCYRQALALDPGFGPAREGLDHALARLGPAGEAMGGENGAQAHLNQGDHLLNRGRLDEAAACYRRALDLDPGLARAHLGLGVALMGQKRVAEATAHYERVVVLAPDHVDAHYNLTLAYEMQGKLEQARETFDRLLRLGPVDPLFRFHVETMCPPIPASNQAIDRYRAELEETLERYAADGLAVDLAELHLSGAAPPLALAYQGRDERPVKEKWATVFQGRLPVYDPPGGVGKPHLGIVVTPGHERTFVRGMRRIVEAIPGARFQVTVVCGGPAAEAVIRPALANPAIDYLHVPPRFDHAAELIHQARFDLLYYREIGTDATNYFLPFCRLAPVQCVSWGTSYTTGIPQVDYYLSCEPLETERSDAHYTETLVRLAGMPTLERPAAPARLPPRSRYGLQDDQHVYLCAQNLLKVHPDFDPLAAEILRRDPAGALVFFGSTHPHLSELLRRRLEVAMPDVVERVYFLPRLAKEDYMNVMALADVSVDTLHFCGSNCTNDAFVMGTPVVTLPGRFQRGRYTYGAYRTMGMESEDCVAGSPEGYVEAAVRLGTDLAYRAEVGRRIAERCPVLFEDQATVRSAIDFFEEAVAQARGE